MNFIVEKASDWSTYADIERSSVKPIEGCTIVKYTHTFKLNKRLDREDKCTMFGNAISFNTLEELRDFAQANKRDVVLSFNHKDSTDLYHRLLIYDDYIE